MLPTMTNYLDENRPHSCHAVGLECQSCVERSAQSVAALCHGLGEAAAERIFFQIFGDPACARMSAQFALAYVAAQRTAADALLPHLAPTIERRLTVASVTAAA